MGVTSTPSTVERQAPTALLALVQHIHTHDLGAPLSIHAPTTAAPFFALSITSRSIESWTSSGLVAEEVEAHPIGHGLISGTLWERVTTAGLLQPHGIRVQVSYCRPVPDQKPSLSGPRRLTAVTSGGAA